MTVPKRLIDGEATELERTLLSSATKDAPSDDAKKRAALALGLLGAGAAVSVPKVAVSSAASGLKIVIAVVALGVIAAVGWKLHRSPELAPPAPSAAAPAPPPEAHRVVHAATPKPVAPTQVTHGNEEEPSAQNNSLADETALVDVAREALGRKTYGVAMRLLDRHTRMYPDGVLAPEAAALRIEVLLAQGDAAIARTEADRFLVSYPQSPLVERVRKLLAEHPR